MAAIAVCAILAFLAPGNSVLAQDGPQDSAFLEVLVLSGLDGQFVHFAEAIIVGAGAQIQQMPPEMATGLKAFYRDAFSARRQRSGTLQAMVAANPAPERIEAALELLREPLVRRLTEIELAASDPESMAEAMAYVENYPNNPVPKRRVQLIRRQGAVDTLGNRLQVGLVQPIGQPTAIRAL